MPLFESCKILTLFVSVLIQINSICITLLIVVFFSLIVDLNQKGNLKIKPIRNREYSTDNKCQNIPDPIPTDQELDNTRKLDDSSLDKTN